MNVFFFNAVRRRLTRPAYPGGEIFRRLSSSVGDAEWSVSLYYAASVYLTAQMLPGIDATVREAVSWDFLWPLRWLDQADADRTLSLLGVACFLSSLAAFQFHRHVVARAVFCALFLMAATVTNSLGGINHPYHAWFWVSFVFVFLPDGDSSALSRAGKLSYLTVIRAAQALFLAFYTMTGAWKVLFGLRDAIAGNVGNFSPDALPLTLANRVLQTGTDPLLADFLINHSWLAWPMFLGLIYIQVVSVAVAFRPSLHVVWGYLQIAFHLGTWLLMEIIFTQHILLLLILLVLTPQRAALRSPFQALADLPLLGWAFRAYRAETHPGKPAVADVTRR